MPYDGDYKPELTEQDIARGGHFLGSRTVFPGQPGALHPSNGTVKQSHSALGREIAHDDQPLCNLLREMTFDNIVDIAYMFNFQIAHAIRKVNVQFDDDSEWSTSFSLDGVGVSDTIGVEHPDKGYLEMGFKCFVAPGRLANYTKIVRFMPKFVLINKLDVSIKLQQSTGFTGERTEMEIQAGTLCPFHLPSVFSERCLSIQVDGPWNRTDTFGIESHGKNTLLVKRKSDVASLAHVNTRDAPEYTVNFPPQQEIGIWFETDWGENNIVVKNYRTNSWAYEQTDIQIGDALISIDEMEVDGHQFELAMKILHEKKAAGGCVVKLRTVEEKIRLIRESALLSLNSASKRLSSVSSSDSPLVLEKVPEELAMRVEIRPLEASIFIILRPVDPNAKSDYRVENRSVSHIIHYKQKGVTGDIFFLNIF